MSEKRWRENIRKVVPYVAGEQPNRPNMIKLNTNENPYPPSPAVTSAMKDMDTDCFRLYPDMDATPLTKAIAKMCGQPERKVFVGVGSDDVLNVAFMTFFNSEKPILFPDITYSFYPVWADLHHIPYVTPALDDDFIMHAEDYKQENGGIIFPNPNAPTSVEAPVEVIEEIIQANPDVIVIVDEAYIDFGGTSVVDLTDKYDNLLVVQTFSKSRSMAGMRIGFAVGNAELIQAMKDVKFSINSYTMNQTAIRMGVEAVNDVAYFEEMKNRIIDTREWTKEKLTELGFTFPESKANFIFATHNSKPAKEIFAYLRSKDIFVRYWDKARINNHLRITIGTQDEMEQLIQALKEYVEV